LRGWPRFAVCEEKTDIDREFRLLTSAWKSLIVRLRANDPPQEGLYSMAEHRIIDSRIVKVRGFQPPWRPVQIIHCSCGRISRWAPSGWIGMRRTPSGMQVGITPQFNGQCRQYLDELKEKVNGE